MKAPLLDRLNQNKFQQTTPYPRQSSIMLYKRLLYWAIILSTLGAIMVSLSKFSFLLASSLLVATAPSQALQYYEDMLPAPNQAQIDSIFLEKWKGARDIVQAELIPKTNDQILKKLKKEFLSEKEGNRIVFACNVWEDPIYAIASSGHSDYGKVLLSYQFYVNDEFSISDGELYAVYLGSRPLNPSSMSAELADRTMAIPIPRGELASVLSNKGLWYYEYKVRLDKNAEDVLTAHLVGNGLKSKTKGVFILNGGMGSEFYDFPQKYRTKLAQAIFLRNALENKNLGQKIYGISK